MSEPMDSPMNELLCNILSHRVDDVPVKVRCDHCFTVNHWYRWQMSALPGCVNESRCVCWACDAFNNPPTVAHAVKASLRDVMDLDDRLQRDAQRGATV